MEKFKNSNCLSKEKYLNLSFPLLAKSHSINYGSVKDIKIYVNFKNIFKIIINSIIFFHKFDST